MAPAANDLSGTSPVDSRRRSEGRHVDAVGDARSPATRRATGSALAATSRAAASITVGLGGEATCTITNDDIAGNIVIVKIRPSRRPGRSTSPRPARATATSR